MVKRSSRPESCRLAVWIAANSIVAETLRRYRTTYHIQNDHATQGFDQKFEHPRTLPDSRFAVNLSTVEATVAEITSGRSIGVRLPAASTLDISVLEDQVESNRFLLSAS